MMLPKPVKQQKEKKPYNSLQRKKEKKPVAPWRENILAHHQPKASTADRGEFPRKVIKELIAEAGGLCQSCRKNPDTTTHHVYPRGRGGRGVKTNGLRLCWPCHDRIQTNEAELQYWISVYREKYGDFFWFDEQDWGEYNRKQAAIREAEEERRRRMAEIEPIVNLLSTAAGRKLKSAEIRLIDGLDEREMAVFANLMKDVIEAQLDKPQIPYGYGFFDD